MMLDRDFWEIASYVVTVVALPFAVGVFLLEQRKERENEEEEAFQHLAEGETTQVQFTYTLADDQGYSDTATVTITITVAAGSGKVKQIDFAATDGSDLACGLLLLDTTADVDHIGAYAYHRVSRVLYAQATT